MKPRRSLFDDPPAPRWLPRLRQRPRTVNIGGRRYVSHGLMRRFWEDIYHVALTIRWPTFFGLAAAVFLVLNALFASLYQLGQHAIANQFPANFGGAFFFSVETLATVGYGDMHPQTVYGHVVATVEIFTGMLSIALVACIVGAWIGFRIDDDTAPLAGGAIGLVVGTTAAVVLYRRRHERPA